MSENQTPLKPTEVRQICLDNGLIIKDPQWQLLEEWADLLLNYNKEINLVLESESSGPIDRKLLYVKDQSENFLEAG